MRICCRRSLRVCTLLGFVLLAVAACCVPCVPVFTLLLYSPDHSRADPEFFFALLKSFFVRCVLGVTTIMASKWESYVCHVILP